MTLPALPRQSQPMVGPGGLATVPWYDLLSRVHTQLAADNSDLATQVADLSEQVAGLTVGEIVGLYSVHASGTLSDGQVVLQLEADQLAPGNGYFYGTSGTGAKGWNTVASTLTAGAAITLTVGADGVTSIAFTGSTTNVPEGANLYFTNARATAACGIFSGTGTPEGVVTAAVGSLFRRTDGGAGTTLYVKESGTGNTGWVAK